MKKEKILVQVEYEIEYETPEGGEAAIQDILKNLPIKVMGASVSKGSFVITRRPETTRLIEYAKGNKR